MSSQCVYRGRARTVALSGILHAQLGRVECLVLEREDFESFLGDLTHHMEREVRRREEIGKQRVCPQYHAAGKDLYSRFQVEAEVTRTERPRERRVMDSTITFDELRQIRTIGTGTFGRVKLVQHRPTVRSRCKRLGRTLICDMCRAGCWRLSVCKRHKSSPLTRSATL
jgi:hypothetical protein